MTEEEYLAHYGVKGMKWYQNIFGDKRKKSSKKETIKETPEQRRERILKSTDPKEIYKNRDVLSTIELTDRINRINTERKLAEIAASERSTGQQKIDKVLKTGKTMNEIYQVYKQPMIQDMVKKLSGKSTSVDYKKALENINDLSNDQITALAKRAASEKALRQFVEGINQSDTNSALLEHLSHVI